MITRLDSLTVDEARELGYHVAGVVSEHSLKKGNLIQVKDSVSRAVNKHKKNSSKGSDESTTASASPSPSPTVDEGAGSAGQATGNVGQYLARKAPHQVTPGTRVLHGQYINDLGRVEPWTAYYDQFGRLIGRTDFNAGNVAQGIPSTHHHIYWWRAGYTPGHIDHIPGVFQP